MKLLEKINTCQKISWLLSDKNMRMIITLCVIKMESLIKMHEEEKRFLEETIEIQF